MKIKFINYAEPSIAMIGFLQKVPRKHLDKKKWRMWILKQYESEGYHLNSVSYQGDFLKV